MSRILCISIFIIILIISDGLGGEVAYSFSDSGEHPLPMGNVTEYNGSDIVTSAINSASIDADSVPAESITVDEVKKEINLKLNVGNQAVKDKGRSLTVEYSGDRTIRQICSVYDYMVGNWSYVPDTRGIEEFQYSNKSLEYGKGKYSGQGDCDDFSILLASLIESIGGTSRIILAYGPMGGHAYTEVYLGKAEGTDNDADRMIKWLRNHYKVPEINAHTDLDTGEVWLNLDWWKEPGGAKHPGGPFFKASNQTPILLRENIAKVPLKPLNDLPIAQFAISPPAPNADEAVIFNASSSRDIGIGGGIERYLWNFGDEGIGEGRVASHVYLQGGTYPANLTVIDNDGAQNGTMRVVAVNALPIPIIDYMPRDPKSDDYVVFDASRSWDSEDGKVSAWWWDFGDGESSTKERPSPHQFEISKKYLINLTVYDKSHANKTITLNLKINEPPVAIFSYSTKETQRYPNENDNIAFDATDCKDSDGNITTYTWTFGDDSLPDTNKTATHIYKRGGNFPVSLRITDDNNATTFENKTITVNWLPIVRISSLRPSYEVSDQIIFDASNSSDNESKILKYAWDFDSDGLNDSGAQKKAYQYLLKGLYAAKLTVTDENGASNSTLVNLSIREKNTKPIVESFSPDKSSPQEAGTTITWTAQGRDSEGDPLLYQFLLDGEIVQQWSSQTAWTWSNENANLGSYLVEVQIKDGKDDEPGSYDAVQSNSFIIKERALGSNYWGHYKTSQADDFAGYVDGYLYDESVYKNPGNCGFKILMNDHKEITVTTGTPLTLSDGYELSLKSIDDDGNKVYLELSKNGEIVDSKVVSPSKDGATEIDKTYIYMTHQSIDQKHLVAIAVHFKNAFRGVDQCLATIDAVWQISEVSSECSTAVTDANVSKILLSSILGMPRLSSSEPGGRTALKNDTLRR
jgi:PKD repeat protein